MTSIKRNILTIKQNTLEVGQGKDLSAPRYAINFISLGYSDGYKTSPISVALVTTISSVKVT